MASQSSPQSFADALARDLGDRSGNVADGLHIASLGGTWLTVV